MAATTIDLDSLLEVREGFRSGRPCIAGTGITVHTLASYYGQGMSAAELHEGFPHAPLAGIHAAIAFYLSHRELIDAEIEEEDRWAEDEARRIGAEFV